jgi:hypothetical protein
MFFRSQGKGGRHLLCWVPWKELTAITESMGLNRVDVSFQSPVDGNSPVSETVCVSSYFKFRTIDEVQKPSDFECYKTSSECFRFQNYFTLITIIKGKRFVIIIIIIIINSIWRIVNYNSLYVSLSVSNIFEIYKNKNKAFFSRHF